MRFVYEENVARLALIISFFVAKQQATLLSIKDLDMLLHAQQVMPPNDYICDVLWYDFLLYKEIPAIYWMTLVEVNVAFIAQKELYIHLQEHVHLFG